MCLLDAVQRSGEKGIKQLVISIEKEKEHLGHKDLARILKEGKKLNALSVQGEIDSWHASGTLITVPLSAANCSLGPQICFYVCHWLWCGHHNLCL